MEPQKIGKSKGTLNYLTRPADLLQAEVKRPSDGLYQLFFLVGGRLHVVLGRRHHSHTSVNTLAIQAVEALCIWFVTAENCELHRWHPKHLPTNYLQIADAGGQANTAAKGNCSAVERAIEECPTGESATARMRISCFIREQKIAEVKSSMSGASSISFARRAV
jgi:hypothetical protein